MGGASIGAALFVITHAIADPGSADSDEVIRTAPESFPDLAAMSAAAPPAPTTPAPKAETQNAPVYNYSGYYYPAANYYAGPSYWYGY